MITRLAAAALLAFAAFAADEETERKTLRDVKSVCVAVDVGPGLNAAPLQEEIERRLRGAHIEIDANATQCVSMNARPLRAMGPKGRAIGLYAVHFGLGFFQTVALTRDATIKSYAATWSVENLAMVPADDLRQTALEMAADLAEKFVKAYRAVNPN